MGERLKLLVVLVIGIFVGLGISLLISPSDTQPKKVGKTAATEKREKHGYRFINPLLECDNFSPSDLSAHQDLKSVTDQYVKEKIAAGLANQISVYYRDLNNGPWIGIGEDAEFAPASLLKVAFLMVALRHSEDHAGFLEKKVTYTEENPRTYVQNIEGETIALGKSYTIKELLESMIINSDNLAMNLIMAQLQSEQVPPFIWSDLGIEDPSQANRMDFLSVKQYSAFFRVLYNSTYLTRQHSEYALELLSQTKIGFIRSRTPNNTVVASKFGERVFADSNVKQLHECAIVYDGTSPYLLCIMTRGTDFATQASVIEDISELVYRARKTD